MSQRACPTVFDSWAEVYDSQPNPLLSLEQRVLDSLLPDVRGLDVLDVGCGTGRWLQRLAENGPRRLLGVDISPEMLLVASAKVGDTCDLRLGSCNALPFDNGSADLMLSSFVLSYVDDLAGFAQEVDRVARPGTTIFLSDMHPNTEAAGKWKRSFAAQGSHTAIRANGWALEQIRRIFLDRGFEMLALMEPGFGMEERRIFEQCDRLDLYELAAGLPAIYVIQLRKRPSAPRIARIARDVSKTICINGARCAEGPDSAVPASLSIVGKYIHSVRERSWAGKNFTSLSGNHLDLSGYLLLPGLINAHDHLEFGLFPNLGNGPYQNAEQWAEDIHTTKAGLIAQHRMVPKQVRVWWGAIRNLLCGVTTVCHHNPLSPELLDPEFPIRVVSRFGWAHSLSREPQLANKFAASTASLPFIVHLAEGVDDASSQEVFELERMHALDQRTVLVHGLACTPEAVALINQRRAALILCPTSNEFLFERPPSLTFLRSVDTVVLGSDSPLTAAGDLLDEIRFTHKKIGVDANSVYAMVTNRSAEVLRLRQGEGRLWLGSVADLIAVRDVGLSPAETLAQLTIEKIEVVIVGGRVQLAGARLHEHLPDALRQGLQPLEVDGVVLWVRAPVDRLLADATEFLGNDLCVGGKRVRRAPAA